MAKVWNSTVVCLAATMCPNQELAPLLDEKLGSKLALPSEQDFRDLWQELLGAPAEAQNGQGPRHGAVANLWDTGSRTWRPPPSLMK